MCATDKTHQRRGIWSVTTSILLLALLCDHFQWHGLIAGHDFRLWQVLVAVILVLIRPKTIVLPKATVFLLVLVVMHSAMVGLLSTNVSYFTATQIVLVFGVFAIFYNLLHNREPRYSIVVGVYYVSALTVSLSIIIEQIIYLTLPDVGNSVLASSIGKWPGPFGIVRAHGLMAEPSQAALILGPGLFVALARRRILSGSVIALAAFLTFSTLTYIASFAALGLFVFLTRGVRIISVSALVLLIILAGYFVEPVTDRITRAVAATRLVGEFQYIDVELYQRELGGSVGSLIVASKVAYENFFANGMLGVGIGNMGASAETFLSEYMKGDVAKIQQNTKLLVKIDTGGSILIRILSELGVVGLTLILVTGFSLFKAIRLMRKLATADRRFVKSDLCLTVGIFITVISAYIVRKDGYLNIYLLFPLAAYVLAMQDVRRLRKLRRKSSLVTESRTGLFYPGGQRQINET